MRRKCSFDPYSLAMSSFQYLLSAFNVENIAALLSRLIYLSIASMWYKSWNFIPCNLRWKTGIRKVLSFLWTETIGWCPYLLGGFNNIHCDHLIIFSFLNSLQLGPCTVWVWVHRSATFSRDRLSGANPYWIQTGRLTCFQTMLAYCIFVAISKLFVKLALTTISTLKFWLKFPRRSGDPLAPFSAQAEYMQQK